MLSGRFPKPPSTQIFSTFTSAVASRVLSIIITLSFAPIVMIIPQKKWDYDNIAKTNPFFAQVWYPNHTKDECNVYNFDDLFQVNGVKWDDIKH